MKESTIMTSESIYMDLDLKKSGEEESEETTTTAMKHFELLQYDEVASFNHFSNATEFLKDHIEKRYELVGGRIRLLLNPTISFKILCDDVLKAIRSVSLQSFLDEISLDLHSNIPSILYSLLPSEEKDDLLPHRIVFASDIIRDMIAARTRMLQLTVNTTRV